MLKRNIQLAAAFTISLGLSLLTGCGSVSRRLSQQDQSLLYSIGQTYVHGTIQQKASDYMVGYLERHPEAVDRLPHLDLAWTHLWENENPFTRSEFDTWLETQKADLLPIHAQSLDDLSGILWDYLEADAEGYVAVSPRNRRIVDSLVEGLRHGYRVFVSKR